MAVRPSILATGGCSEHRLHDRHTSVMTYTAPNTFGSIRANIMVTSPSGGFTSPINFTFDGTSTIISDPQFDLTGSDPDGVFHLHIQFAFMDGSVTSLGMNSYEKQNPRGRAAADHRVAPAMSSSSLVQ